MEKQEFQVGDTIYCIDDDFKEFEDIVITVTLERDNTIGYVGRDYDDFTKEDIGNRVFKTREDRLDFLEGNFL